MKSNYIIFDSYLLCNLITEYNKTGLNEQAIDGTFLSSITNNKVKASLKIKIVDDEPIGLVPWRPKITMSNRFTDRPFTVKHNVLNKYSYSISDIVVKENPHIIKVPMLYYILKSFSQN